jgi:hydroxymethylpyrimidine pyrophosphatase-like HAD family hydrolase
MATIAVDFDGTIVTHKYPEIGEPVDKALYTLRRLRSANHKIILFTMRSGEKLDEAIKYLEDAGIQLYGINENPSQGSWTASPKPYAHLYIDDAAAGCPLTYKEGERPVVDWEAITRGLEGMEYL